VEGENILWTERPILVAQRIFKGKERVTHSLMKYYLYILKPEDKDSVEFGA